MKSAVLTEPQEFELQDRPRPDPGPGEVLVAIRDVGICGSDVHYYERGRIGDYVVENSLILGHESAGEIVEVGDDVDGLAVGDRVTLEPGVPCRRCAHCKRGDYHLCESVTFMATPPHDGAFAEYVAWPADFVYELPEGVSQRDGALCEPLSVAIHATRQAGIELGDSVLVTGAGPIGMLTIATARAAGASEVYVSDVVEEKLDRAAEWGADGTIDVSERDLATATAELTDGRGVDAVVEASGAASVYGEAVAAVRRGGTITCVGISSNTEIPFDFTQVTNRELTINGSFRYRNTFPEAIELLERGAVDVAALVDHEYDFAELPAAFEAAAAPEAVKTMVSL